MHGQMALVAEMEINRGTAPWAHRSLELLCVSQGLVLSSHEALFRSSKVGTETGDVTFLTRYQIFPMRCRSMSCHLHSDD